MSYEQLSLNSFITEMKEVTVGSHPRKFCFVLGAGASRTSGIKSGQELVKIWDKELRERNTEEYERWRKELSITDKNMSSFYSQYYEKRFYRCRADGYNYIEKIMEPAKPSAGYVMLAHLLTQTPHNVVITTNFDHLTEDAVNYYAQNTPLVIGHEVLAHYVSGQPVRPTIIKIHRDLLFDPKSRSEDLEKLPDSWRTALELIFENYHPVFIGYAGNDKSLMDFLLENSNKFSDDTWKFPYWMLYKTDTLDGKVKNFLEASNGFYIPHSGFDEVLIQLGAIFNYIIPTEEDFLDDARKRYKALADAIDAFSDKSKSSNVADTTTVYYEEAKRTEESDEDDSSVNQAIEKITSQSEIQRMYRDSVTLMREKKYEQAVAMLKQLTKSVPENPRYLNNLGMALRRLNKNEEALLVYRKAAELAPENELSHFYVADTLELLNQKQEALTEYQKMVEINPKSAISHYCVATLQIKMQEWEDALISIQKAIAIEPNEAEYYEILGSALYELGRIAEADEATKKADELKNN